MTMKRIKIYIVLALLSALAACQNENLLTPSENGDIIEIKVKPKVMTKSLVDVTTDNIYAYTYGDSEALACSALKQITIEDGVYSYSVPGGTESIVFSNHATSDDFALTKTAEGGLQVTRLADNSLYDTDIVAGAIKMSETDENGGLNPHLSRLNSFITAELRMKSIDGTELDLNNYMTYAYLRLPNQACSVIYNADGSISVSESLFNGQVPEDPINPEDPGNSSEYAENDALAAMREDNIITNGSFESIDESNAFLTGWSQIDDKTILNSTDAYDGLYCLQIEQGAIDETSGYKKVAQQQYSFEVEGGKKYRFSMCVKSPDGISDITVSFNSTENNSRQVKVSDTWQLYQTDIVNPDYNTDMYLSIHMGNQTGVCYIDNIQMYAIEDEPYNYLANGSFEQVTDGIPDGWTILNGEEFVSIEESTVKEGSKSLRLNATNDSANTIRIASPLIEVTEGRNYEYLNNICNLSDETYTITYTRLYGVSSIWEDGNTIQETLSGSGNIWSTTHLRDFDGCIHGPYYCIIESDPYQSICLDNFRVYDMNIKVLPLTDAKRSENNTAEEKYYMMVGDSLAVALGNELTYGYIPVTVGMENATEANEWTFTKVEEGYTITDCYGRFLYKVGSYASFNISTEMPAEGHIWTVTEIDDGTYKIFNTMQESWIQYNTIYGNFCAEPREIETGIYPTLVPVSDCNHDSAAVKTQRSNSCKSLTEGQTVYYLADEMATLPTASGKNSRLELVIGNKSGTEMTLSKDFDYQFLPNKHYTFTLVVRRNERDFEFHIEDIIEEEINIDLN